MIKQEEIVEGVAEEISCHMLGKNYHELPIEEKEYLLFVAGCIMRKEASQGAVLQSDIAIFQHGYCPKIEPLIEKEK